MTRMLSLAVVLAIAGTALAQDTDPDRKKTSMALLLEGLRAEEGKPANLVLAISAGNEGPGHYTVGSPGSAARALTAGASTVPHFVGAPLTVGGGTYGVASGDLPIVTADLTAPLAVVGGGTASTGGLKTACTTLVAGSLTGKIALISRGGCTFSQKVRSAQDAGAIAAIVVNNVAGDPTAMGLGGIPNEPTIPAYMASGPLAADLERESADWVKVIKTQKIAAE